MVDQSTTLFVISWYEHRRPRDVIFGSVGLKVLVVYIGVPCSIGPTWPDIIRTIRTSSHRRKYRVLLILLIENSNMLVDSRDLFSNIAGTRLLR